MKILIFVKAIFTEEGVPAMNHDDKNMLEMALRVKDEQPSTEIGLICFGGEDAKRMLREGLAAGADRACLILRNGEEHVLLPERKGALQVWDSPERTAEALTAGLSAWHGSAEYDLILCGYQSEDCRAGAVGPMVAERLGLPHVSLVREFYTVGSCLIALRDLTWGTEFVELERPCLLCGTQGRQSLRGISYMGIQEALEKELTVIQEEASGAAKKSELSLSAVVSQNRKQQIAEFEKGDSEIRAAILLNLKLNCQRK